MEQSKQSTADRSGGGLGLELEEVDPATAIRRSPNQAERASERIQLSQRVAGGGQQRQTV